MCCEGGFYIFSFWGRLAPPQLLGLQLTGQASAPSAQDPSGLRAWKCPSPRLGPPPGRFPHCGEPAEGETAILGPGKIWPLQNRRQVFRRPYPLRWASPTHPDPRCTAARSGWSHWTRSGWSFPAAGGPDPAAPWPGLGTAYSWVCGRSLLLRFPRQPGGARCWGPGARAAALRGRGAGRERLERRGGVRVASCLAPQPSAEW